MNCGKRFLYQTSFKRHLASHSSDSRATGEGSDREEDLDEEEAVKYDPDPEDRLGEEDSPPMEVKVDEEDVIKKDVVKNEEPELQNEPDPKVGKGKKRGRPRTKVHSDETRSAGLFNCEICGKNFQYEKSFKKHIETHSSEGRDNAVDQGRDGEEAKLDKKAKLSR